ncbi:hypothetical protein [Hymenobacter canadensis]|uniref:Glycosyltransferase family 1 protein n=1 Tax=Hymenobacter canadensis TaxID=2999067 RepID=A0ABY7LRX3_9BACT|nr:hypothetical protein [Hymenobacter canadensis]WBA41965.1 hypothetical protein O3303_00035 [Hymenobacter canadensis]
MADVLRGIKANNAFYHSLVGYAEHLQAQGDVPECLQVCQEAANYATFQYCGFYAEPRLEQLLIRIRHQAAIGPIAPAARPAATRLRVLHYATSVFEVGGHTRLLDNWIRADAANQHDVLLTQQTVPVPAFLTEAVEAVQGNVTVLDSADVLSNARHLAGVAGGYDVIILHHHANDVVPILALAAAERSVPVCVLNHGDHRFWLGVVVCDLLVEIRDNLIAADKQRRGIQAFGLLPIPVHTSAVSPEAYHASRAILGILPEQVMLLSIGASYKYDPIDEKNFFADILPVLERYEQAVLVVVGIDPASDLAIRYAHPRLRFVAPTMHLADFHNACDIYLEGYPFSSFTAYLEVGAQGKPICRMYAPPLLNAYAISTYPAPVHYPADRAEWTGYLQHLITDAQARLVAGRQEYANSSTHAPAAIQEHVRIIYRKAAAVAGKAVVNSLPTTVFSGPNDQYLYKMQYNPERLIVLHKYFKLPLTAKLHLVAHNIRSLMARSDISVRDLFWFVFKAK